MLRVAATAERPAAKNRLTAAAASLKITGDSRTGPHRPPFRPAFP